MDLLVRFMAIIDITGLPRAQANNTTLSTILNTVFGVVASMAVLIVVIGGFRYILARGDPNGTAQARNTILYAVIGLIVTLAAYSIVTFVIGRVT